MTHEEMKFLLDRTSLYYARQKIRPFFGNIDIDWEPLSVSKMVDYSLQLAMIEIQTIFDRDYSFYSALKRKS